MPSICRNRAFRTCLCRALTSPIQPVFKILNFNDVGDLRISNFHRDRSQSLSDVCDPLVTTRHSEGLGDGFVERRGGHVERVRSLVQIMDNDCAGFEGHAGNLPYSLFVRFVGTD